MANPRKPLPRLPLPDDTEDRTHFSRFFASLAKVRAGQADPAASLAAIRQAGNAVAQAGDEISTNLGKRPVTP